MAKWKVWRSPIEAGRWKDEQGHQWKRRGDGQIGLEKAKRLLFDPDVRVHLLYLWYEDREVPVEDRPAFWGEVEPNLPDDVEDRTIYEVAEFRRGDRKLLLFEKFC